MQNTRQEISIRDGAKAAMMSGLSASKGIDTPRESYVFIKSALEQEMSWALQRRLTIFIDLEKMCEKGVVCSFLDMSIFVEGGFGSGWWQIMQEYIQGANIK
jgi:hypothetical protein